MPRKSARKEVVSKSKEEEIAPRRSGRAVTTKQESSTRKDASRSRRSSTAAQTAASVAESKSPKVRTSTHRESTPPSDSKTRGGREGVESPATRVKSTRRSTSRINYKESDGEEEVQTPKFDKNFESGEEFDDSESDEKSKPQVKGRAVRATTTKSRSSKEAEISSRSRRGRPSKKKADENKTVDISDDSMEPEVVETKQQVKEKVTPKPTRGRRSKSEVVDVELENESKPSRRSSRASSNKEETSKKRPSRGVKAKRYAEDEEEIEEILDVKDEEANTKDKEIDIKDKAEVSRKRKRESQNEESPKKRIKEDEENKEEKMEETVSTEQSLSEKKTDLQDKLTEEPMEVEETDSGVILQNDSQVSENENPIDTSEIQGNIAEKEKTMLLESEESEENSSDGKIMETAESTNMAEPVQSPKECVETTNSEPSKQAVISEPSKQAVISEPSKQAVISKSSKQAVISEPSKQAVISEPSKQTDISEPSEQAVISEEAIISKSSKEAVISVSSHQDLKAESCGTKESSKQTFINETLVEVEHSNSPSENISETNENIKENIPDQITPNDENLNQNANKSVTDSKANNVSMDANTGIHDPVTIPTSNSEPQKPAIETQKINEFNETNMPKNDYTYKSEPLPPTSSISAPVESTAVLESNMQFTEKMSDSSLNGEEKLSNSVAFARDSSSLETDISVLKANGAHDDLPMDSPQFDSYILPGRKYVHNSKLNENVLQSVKNQTFGFLSLNLCSDMNVQKEKLLKELHDFNSQIVCLQQVPKPFYLSVLEPSLDALGYKSIFSQPEDSLKGIATFYKSSYFKINNHSNISLKQLIEKELETSSLEPASKAAVKSYIKRCGSVLLTHFVPVMGSQSLVVANVQIPPSDVSSHALQVSCLAREIIRVNGGVSNPLLIAGEFNISEKDASYQLLRDGYLANEMIDELQKRKDIVVPEKENSSLVDLLWKSFQHPSSSLCSCYRTVLDHEMFIPELKSASPDILWFSSDTLLTVGVVDVVSEKLGDRRISLKADIAFTI